MAQTSANHPAEVTIQIDAPPAEPLSAEPANVRPPPPWLSPAVSASRPRAASLGGSSVQIINSSNLVAGDIHPHSLRRAASAASMATVPPASFRDLTAIYSVVAARRDFFDGSLWATPTMAFTAQSFLFATGLDANTTRLARIIATCLSLIITMLSLQLFTRQLAAEAADHDWCAQFERRHDVDMEDRAFGETWHKYRFRKPASAGFLGFLALHRAFPLWRNGLLCFAAAAILVLLVSIFRIDLLKDDSPRH